MQSILTDVLPLISPFLADKFLLIPSSEHEGHLDILYGAFRAEIDNAGHYSIHQRNRLVKLGEENSLREALDRVLHLLPTFQMEVTGLASAA
jgi:hypothetical protein